MAATAAPESTTQLSANPLRPNRLDEMIGQQRARALMARVIRASVLRQRPLDHILLLGASGLGKTTLANVVANERRVDIYALQAPVSFDTLLDLRERMLTGDILFVDEIHMQAIQERRGRSSITQPEVFYNVLEDRKLITPAGVLDFPNITVIGATTDEGMLPDPFINRFPLRPVLEPYTQDDLTRIAKANGSSLQVEVTWEAARVFARACRGVPRHINNYVRNGAMLGERIDTALAEEVVQELNRTTDDGLSLDMQNVLRFLYRRCRRVNGEGTVTYQGSVATIATAIGKSRDTKAVQLRVEPYLIEKGYLQVGHGGRSLTPSGVRRAKELGAR